MSFGFGVGDFIAVGKLIKDITGCLQSTGGARSEYQELIREFEALDAALRYLDRLEGSAASSIRVDSIKCAALSCRLPLEEFLAKARQYENSLGIWNRSQMMKKTTDKIAWTFGRKDDITCLQTYLSVHIGTINMLLAEHGLEQMNMAGQRAGEASKQVREQLEHNKTVLDGISKNLPAQALLLRNVHSMVGGLYKLICGEMRISLEHFTQVVSKVCVNTQQIYTVVLEIRDSITVPDTRWSYFQAPFVVEDALGFKFPVPSEYDYDMLDNIIRHRFKEGAGSTEVVLGNYEFCKTNLRSATITPTSRLVPGTAITMAVIIRTVKTSDEACPMPKCPGLQATDCPGGGYVCSMCNVWFDRAAKKEYKCENFVQRSLATNTDVHLLDAGSSQGKKRKLSQMEEDEQSLRNVKWTPYTNERAHTPIPDIPHRISPDLVEEEEDSDYNSEISSEGDYSSEASDFLPFDSSLQVKGGRLETFDRTYGYAGPYDAVGYVKSDGQVFNKDEVYKEYQEYNYDTRSKV